VASDLALAKAGNVEIIAPESPLIVFVWDEYRVLPVRIASLSITEEAYDIALHPIRAKVDLTLNVLSYADLKPDTPGYNMFKQHHVDKESMAKKKITNNLQRNNGVMLKLT
jgi:hypothetical protein